LKVKIMVEGVERPGARMSGDARYRLLVDALIDYAIYMLDPSGIVTSWNSGAHRLEGYTEREIVGEHFSRFYTDEDRQAGLPERALATAARDGKFESQGWRIRKDGTRFWAHVVIDPVRDASQRIVGFAKVTRDLSELHAAEAALRQSEEQFRFLVQSVTDYAIYMIDPTGRVSSWNLGAQRIKGYCPDDIIGEHFSRFYTEEDRAANQPQRALEAAERNGTFEKEGWRVRKDGTRFWANVVTDPIRDGDGRLLGFAKVTRDITERLAAQQALDEAREALLQSQKLEAIGQLTGGIAHDFNNLLTAVIGSLDLLRKRQSAADHRTTRLLDNAIQGAQRGIALTQRMLAFARRQELTLEPIHVPALVHGMSDLLQQSIGPSVMIEARFPLVLDAIRTDANQLELALLNVAVNARDAMPNGGVITIAARPEIVGAGNRHRLKPGRYVCLSVTDTGEGMDEATLARAMEPFFTTKGVGKGTGLGLSMVQGLAQQSGGGLVLKSRPGTGTTVELWLPAAEPKSDVAASIEETSAVEPEPAARTLCVLAVDDDPLVLLNTVAILEDLGHRVFEATSGVQALDILRREKTIELVITDQAMPHMTGAELARAIKAERPDLPIILATGYAELADVDPALLRLSKPFRQEDLARALMLAVRRADTGGRVVRLQAS
jgi:PAS domain S-box-containing protein